MPAYQLNVNRRVRKLPTGRSLGLACHAYDGRTYAATGKRIRRVPLDGEGFK